MNQPVGLQSSSHKSCSSVAYLACGLSCLQWLRRARLCCRRWRRCAAAAAAAGPRLVIVAQPQQPHHGVQPLRV